MKQGASISGGMHVLLVLLVLLGGSWFKAHDSELIRVAEVSLISAAEFDAAASAAPSVPKVDPEALAQPAEIASDAVTPEAEVAPDLAAADAAAAPAAADVEPDVSGLQALAEPAVEATQAPVQPDVVGEDAAALGESLVAPVVVGNDAPNEVLVPSELAAEPVANDAPRIDTESAPEQPDDAVTSATVVEEAVPEEAVDVVVEQDPTTAEAPEEATAQVVPEPVEEQSAQAPLVASRPLGRPADLQARVDAARQVVAAAAADASAAAAADAEAAAIEAALEVASAEAVEQPATITPALGSGMTAGEKDGLRLAVQKCWNVPTGLRDAENLVVTVGVELSQDGKIVGKPFLIEPTGELAPGIEQAFQAGRRALIKCAPYDLPPDKYEQWRNLEVVFNPKNMVVR